MAQAPASEPPPATQPAPAEVPAGHLEQLALCRSGILDAQARPEERRRWATQLLTYDSPQASGLVVELLGTTSQPAVQAAMCAAIAERQRSGQSSADPAWIDPLLHLLAAQDAQLRRLAAAVLADFPGDSVTDRLGSLAADPQLGIEQRQAAIDALSARAYQRPVAAQLMSLLDREDPQITARVLAALEPLTDGTLGSDVQRWRDWWAAESQRDELDWLTQQARVQRLRARAGEQQQRQAAERTAQDLAARDERIVELQTELFRSLPPDQRETRLSGWLADPLAAARRGALRIIASRIADEGYRPGNGVLTALLGLLNHDDPAIRRTVLDILPHVSEPAVAEAVLARLAQETDAATRAAVFAALGKLAYPPALPALVAEIIRPECTGDCLREAASALGLLAARVPGAPGLADAVTPLRQRYQTAPADDTALRAALLRAMAGVADPSYADDFLAAVDGDVGDLIRPGLRGLMALRNGSKVPRIRTLVAHPDPRVRLAACDALGGLGREDADLETLLIRLNPATEQDTAAREAAWSAFRAILAGRPVQDRLNWSARLRDLPGLEVRYLQELERPLKGGNGTPEHNAVRERLADALVNAGQFAEAAGYLRDLYASYTSAANPTAFDTGLRWLDATLKSEAHQNLPTLIEQLATAAEAVASSNGAAAPDAAAAGAPDGATGGSPTAAADGARLRIIETVARYADAPAVAESPDKTRALLTQLEPVPADKLGQPWGDLITRLRGRVPPATP